MAQTSGKFVGSLNANEYYNGLFNAYALIQTIADNLDGLKTTLASKFKTDGGMYRDNSVFTFMDVLTSREWDPTDTNVLATEQKVVPVQQAIVLNQKRQIALTTDNGYLSKKAWQDEGSYSAFNSVVQAQVGNTKKLFEQRMVDVAVGTMVAACKDFSNNSKGTSQNTTVGIASTDSESVRVRKIGKKIADILVDVADSTRDYNDLGNMTAFGKDKLMIVWNAAYLNEFDTMDLPVIFHKEGIIDFAGDKLPGRYFGDVANATSHVGSGKIIKADGTYDTTKGDLRFVDETVIAAGSVGAGHYFPGDKVPSAAVVYDATGSKFNFAVYVVDPKVICKIMHNDSIKYLSSFETSTEFFNAKNLSQNRYLTWMYAKPEYLKGYPLITLKETTIS